MKPSLRVEYLQSVCRLALHERDYSIEVNVRNPSDGPNSISAAELEIVYILDSSPVSMRLRAVSEEHAPRSLGVPTELGPRTSREGFLHFVVLNAALEGKRIQRYNLRLADTFGNTQDLPLEMIRQEKKDDG